MSFPIFPPRDPPPDGRHRAEEAGHGALVLLLSLLLVGLRLPDFVLAAALGCVLLFVAAAVWQVLMLRAWLHARQADDVDVGLRDHPRASTLDTPAPTGVDSPPTSPGDPGAH
jgi:hypothetical protein